MNKNVCPNCGQKLGFLFMKQNCPKCGVNLAYFDMENQLERDAEQAEREFAALDRFKKGIKTATVGSVFSIVRLVIYVLTLGIMFFPLVRFGENGVGLLQAFSGMVDNLGNIFVFCNFCISALSAVFLVFASTKWGFVLKYVLNGLNFVFAVVLAIVISVSGGGALLPVGYVYIAMTAVEIGYSLFLDLRARLQKNDEKA